MSLKSVYSQRGVQSRFFFCTKFIDISEYTMKTNQTTGLVPQVFNYDSQKVEVVVIDEAPYWVAKDVCEILGIRNVTQAIEGDPAKNAIGLDEDEKLTYSLYRSGQKREMWLINESGLYNLIFRSNKPEAKLFRKWVTSEVLPAIRKTGGYALWNQENALYVKQVLGVSVRGTVVDGKPVYHLQDSLRAIGSPSKARNIARSQWLRPYVIKLSVQTFHSPTYFIHARAYEYLKLRKSPVQLSMWEKGGLYD